MRKGLLTFGTRVTRPLAQMPSATKKLRNLTNHVTSHLNFNSFQGFSPEFLGLRLKPSTELKIKRKTALALKIDTGNTFTLATFPTALLTTQPNPAQGKNKRCAAKHHPLRTFLYRALLSLWRRVARHQ